MKKKLYVITLLFLKKLGFKFDKNNKYRISDDKNSFILYNCISKKKKKKIQKTNGNKDEPK